MSEPTIANYGNATGIPSTLDAWPGDALLGGFERFDLMMAQCYSAPKIKEVTNVPYGGFRLGVCFSGRLRKYTVG